MRLIGERAEVSVDIGNQVLNNDLLEGAEIERASPWTRTRGSRVGGTRTTDAAIFHHDDERLCFSLRDQVVHDEASVALAAPAGFVLAAAVLEVEYRVTFAGVLVVVRRRVNVDMARLVARLRKVIQLAKLAVRHVFERVEVTILGRNFHRTAPATGAVEIMAVRI